MAFHNVLYVLWSITVMVYHKWYCIVCFVHIALWKCYTQTHTRYIYANFPFIPPIPWYHRYFSYSKVHLDWKEMKLDAFLHFSNSKLSINLLPAHWTLVQVAFFQYSKSIQSRLQTVQWPSIHVSEINPPSHSKSDAFHSNTLLMTILLPSH